MARNRTIDIPVSLYNYGGGVLTGLTFETQTGTGITAGVINNGDNILTPGENQNITLRLTSSTSAPDTTWAAMTARVNEGLQKTLNANISIVQLIPIITTSPSYIDTGIVRGNQKIATFTITNTGEETLRNARIEGPSTSWMTLTNNRAIGDIKPGTSTSIGIMFNPPATLAQGVYDDSIVIYSDNHIPYTYHIQVTVTSNAVGNVMFDVLNEFMEDVPGATITLQHQLLTELIYTLRTGTDGTVMLYDIPEGRYSFNISATGHKSYSGTFVISPGITTTVPIALEVTLVQVEWSVTPIVIQDRYEIVITQTFETNVPTPVLVIEPAGITVPELAPGQVFNGEFTVSNYGLIALNNVNIQFPTSFGEYNIELLATLPKTLNAMQKVTVPYRITRRLTIASYQPSAMSFRLVRNLSEEGLPTSGIDSNKQLIEEVMGYGGNPCYNSFTVTVTGTAIICPNTAQAKTVTKTAGYTVIVPIPGSNCSISGGGVPIGGGGGGGGSYGGGVGGQTGGGGVAPSSGTPITTIASETCFSPRCIAKWLMPETQVCTGSSVIMANGTYEFSETDMSVPAPAIPIEWRRAYRSNRILKTSGNWVFGEPGDGPLGFGWMTEYFARIENSDTYIDGQGIYTVFKKDSSGNFLTDMENGLILKKTSTGYEITEMGGYTYAFNASGTLTGIKDLRGNTITLIYDSNNRLTSVKDVTGRQVLTFAYNSGGRISSVTDIANRTVSYEYDTIGNLTKAISPQQSAHSYTYNNNHGITTKSNPLNETYTIEYQYADKGIISKITDPAGKTMPYIYDFKNGIFYVTDANGAKKKKIINETGKLLLEEEISGTVTTQTKKIEYLDNRIEKITDSTGNITTIQRDEWRNVIKAIDGEGNETKITYNNLKKPLTITDPLGNITRMEYDQYGNLIKIIQAEGKPEQTITSYAYNGYNQITSTTTGGATTTINYNSLGLPSTIADPLGNTTTIQYDAYGNAIAVIDPSNNKTEFTYDINGNRLTAKDPLGNITKYEYNLADRPTKATDALNRVTNTETDYKGRITSITDALNNKKTYQYDGNGNLIKINEGSAITTMTYDLSNRLSTVTDPEGNKTNYEYAGAGCSTCGGGGSVDSPIKITDPLGNLTKYIYDKTGKPTGLVDRNGNIIAFTYDAIGRLIKKTYPDSTPETYSYDAMSRLLTATNSNATLTFAYDTLGRVKSFTDGRLNKTITYEYDKNDSRTKMIDAEGRITKYAYNPLNLLTSITNPSGKIFNFTYDALGRRTGLTYPNGINAAYAYDPASQLTELANKLSATQITKNAYTYDVVGNRVTNTDLAGAHNYQYDTTYQLINATHPTITEAFTYDKNGNRKTETKGTTAINYTHTAGNRIQTKDGETYTHDKNGNIISDLTSAGTTTYTYDYENRLIGAVMPDGTIAEYKYDPFGRRIEKAVTASGATTITRYLYDGDNILAEYDENNNLKTKYTHNLLIDDPLAMERNNKTYFYHKDALGSITSITDETGNVVQEYQYDSFGNITYMKNPNFIQPFTFTGREFDPETGLFYYRLRTFNSKLGIFHQEDPIGFVGGDVNLYRYVGNNPVNFVDPLGLWKASGHTALTQDAMSSFATIFSGNDISVASYANVGVDMIINQMSNSAHYMPGSRNEAEAFINLNLKNAIQFEVAGNHGEAMKALGIGLHILQDRYAHYEQDAGWLSHLFNVFNYYHPDNPNSHDREYATALALSKSYLSVFLNEVNSRKCK